jgi:prepilin-type N-terminal cleavage/methylation domain-containing protein/prepilin-type processing-associated H-X9-DG protein
MKKQRRRKGFTLIELLVVIAVISILAAILFPVFAQAREKARSITCASNMKQLATAWLMYAQDYDDTFPLAQFPRRPGPGTVYWMEVIDPYVKGGIEQPARGSTFVREERSVYTCPSYLVPAPDQDEAGTLRDSWVPAVGRYPLASYAPNLYITSHPSFLGNPAAPDLLGYPGTLASIGDHSRIVLLGENHDSGVHISGYGGTNNYTRAARRHSDGAHCAFVDGHVKWDRGGRPQYGATPDWEWPGAQVCWSKYDERGRDRNCTAYFQPRGG